MDWYERGPELKVHFCNHQVLEHNNNTKSLSVSNDRPVCPIRQQLGTTKYCLNDLPEQSEWLNIWKYFHACSNATAVDIVKRYILRQ